MAGESAREEARRAREKAERLARRAEMFEKGADGEVATASLLAGLSPEWSAIHDVRWPSRRLANIDHILVGPGGIFVIDSKNWSGRITVDGGHLRQNGRSREKAVAGCADAALAVAELAGPFADRVFPVLCFTRDETITGWSRDVMVCSTSTLTQMALSRPLALTPAEATDVWFRLDAQLRAAMAPPEARTVKGRSARARAVNDRNVSRQSARSRRAAQRRRSGLRQFVFSLIVLAAFVAFGPQLARTFGGVVADQFTRSITACDEGPLPDVSTPPKSRQQSPAGGGRRPQDQAGTASASREDDC